MLTKEQAERIKELAEVVAKAKAEVYWAEERGTRRDIEENEKDLEEAQHSFWDYIDSLTEPPLPLKRFKVRYRLADGLSAKTVLMDLPSIDFAWNEARKFAREQGPSCRIEGIEEIES